MNTLGIDFNYLLHGPRLAIWAWFGLFGQAEVILPITLLAVLWLLWTKQSQQTWDWIIPLFAVSVLTIASKIAFIGWGIGLAMLDFTGFSGHAVLAGGVWPVILGRVITSPYWKIRCLLIGCGYGIAMLVAVSRIPTGAHSLTEALTGLVLGITASALAFKNPVSNVILPNWLIMVTAALLVSGLLIQPPPPHTQGLITQVATHLSGHYPYTRSDLYNKSVLK